MIEKRDITGRNDIDELFEAFYDKAVKDDVIGHVFTEVIKIDLKTHLPVIADFWESMIFGTDAYHGRPRSPMQVHLAIDDKYPLKPEHFARWLELFAQTVDKTFSGKNATFIKERSRAIGANMLRRVEDRKIHRSLGNN